MDQLGLARTPLAARSTPINIGTLRVARRATAIRENGVPDSRPLADWRPVDAYVLLGDPGAGKSWSLDAESAACGGVLISARDIIAGIALRNVVGQTVFIDALDEVRAGASDSRVPFDAIRAWLDRQGRPRFRLSCREADWLGQSDRRALERVAPDGRVEVLHLEPFTRDDMFTVLRHRTTEVPDPQAFWDKTEQLSLTGLFGNPLMLDLTIKAVAAVGGNWTSSRQGIYEAACRQLATETSEEHLAVRFSQPGDVDRLLDDAGLLCAVLLLSGRRSLTQKPNAPQDAVTLSTLPESLQFWNAQAALSTKVFSTVAGLSSPRHRTIAEYLAAKALSKRLDAGLPLARLLALIQGFDGRPVDPLRGLFAWLVVHHQRDRQRLLRLDPLGVVLNGDVAALSASDRLALLEALGDAARQDKRFRRGSWVSHPFGSLATRDMAATYDRLLRATSRDDAHQAFIDCVLDALKHGERMPELAPALEAWIEDRNAWIGNRIAAFEAWKHNNGFQPVKAREWLDGLAAGTIVDRDDRLTGVLLTDLYPEYVGPREVLKYLRPYSRQNLIAEYSTFWQHSLLQRSRPQDFADLADAWVAAKPVVAGDAQDYYMQQLSGELLGMALVHAGDDAADERLYAWLGICLDEYGFSKLRDDSRREVAQWLEARPDRIKTIVRIGYHSTRADKQGHRAYWEADQRLHGARKPSDWLFFLLDIALNAEDEELAKYSFQQVAHVVVDPPSGFDTPTMEYLEHWVEAQALKWPLARGWLQQAWTSDAKDWRGDHLRRERQYKAQQMQAREQRKQANQPYLEALRNGTAPVGVMHQLALAHDARFSNIHGTTPLDRVQDLLVTDEETAIAALAGLDLVLARNDIPSADEILDSDAKGKYHYIRPVALLAASHIFENSPEAPLSWSDGLAQQLVAFYLTDGVGEMPGWYRRLIVERPALVAPIMVRYAAPRLRRKGNIAITGLWALSRESDHRALTPLVLPILLDRFPLRTSEAGRDELNRSLLAALYLLDDAQASRIVQLKLAQPGLDPAQRICWLAADLPYRADAVERLAEWVGKNERRAVTLGAALYEQGSLGRTAHRLSPRAVRRLIEVLAPITPRDLGSQAGIVTVANHREETVRGLFEALSSNPGNEARFELRALGESNRLGKWTEVVEYSLSVQQATTREALFRAPDPAAVALVIANLAPANAADLQALVVQYLGDIEAELRGADTHLIRQFWQKTGAGKKPHDENYCRDVLLDKLRARIAPLNVSIAREQIKAADKRVDMAAEFMHAGRRISVPIEVKKESDIKLWTAWRDQLQRLYTIDPASDGFGVYLVLWFGAHPRATPEGVKPRDASQLRELIVERIPESDRYRLSVAVLDLSLPTSS